MPKLARTLSNSAPHILSLLRAMTGLVILQFGLSKVIGFPTAHFHVTNFLSLEGASGFIELIGGALITVGLFTRLAAFILSGEMAFAYFIAHAPRNFFPINNGGSDAILFCFIFFYLAFAGPGPWSLDGLRRKA